VFFEKNSKKFFAAVFFASDWEKFHILLEKSERM